MLMNSQEKTHQFTVKRCLTGVLEADVPKDSKLSHLRRQKWR